MTSAVTDITLLQNQVDRLKEPPSWYKSPKITYIPVIGPLLSCGSQFALNRQLNEMKQVILDMPNIPVKLVAEGQPPHLGDHLEKEVPILAVRALELIKVSNHHAIVSIIQGVLLSALVISTVALGILNPTIGIPLFVACAMITAGQGGLLVFNTRERTNDFQFLVPK